MPGDRAVGIGRDDRRAVVHAAVLLEVPPRNAVLHGDDAGGVVAEVMELGRDRRYLVRLDGEQHDVVRAGLARVVGRRDAVRGHFLPVFERHAHAVRTDRREVRPPRDQRDGFAGGGEQGSEVSADGAGADHRDLHLRIRARSGLSTMSAIPAAAKLRTLATMKTVRQPSVPVARDVREGHQQRRHALGGVKEAGVRRCVGRAVGVGAGRGKETVDLAPGEEDQARQQHEQDRIGAEAAQQQDADSFQREGQEHRVLAADPVGDPAAHRAGEPVQHAVEGERKGECRQHQASMETGTSATCRSRAIGASCAVRHEATRGHQHEHPVHHPEDRRPEHAHRVVVASRRSQCGEGGLADPGDARRLLQEPAEHEDREPLEDAESQEGGVVAVRPDEGRDRNYRQRRAPRQTPCW